MIEQNVQVVRCQDDRIWVRMGVTAGCQACEKGQGCGAGIFAKLLQTKPVTLELERRDVEVEPGQMVTLAFPEHVYLKLVFGYYGWPLLAALGGAFVGYGLASRLLAGPVLLDAVTLGFGVIAGGLVMRVIKQGSSTQTVLNSLQASVYFPSDTPNMCNRVVIQP